MELNTEIWGTTEQQTGQISNIGSAYGVFKSSLATCDTLKHYAENIGKSEPIDESVNYWQIADDSMFNHYVYIRRDGNNRHIYESVKNIKPKSIFLVMRPPVGNNLHFDISNASCPIWLSSVSSNLPYNNYGDIITTFNYNGICARYLLNCFKKDDDGNPTGNVTSFSVYDYFNSDENGEPIKDQYVIVAISSDIFAVQSNGANAYNVNHVFYPVSSTPVSTPIPNYYYTDNDYIAYNRTTCLIGHNVLSSNYGYGTQQGSFGQNGNASWYTYDDRFWEIRNYLNSNNQYIEYFAFTGTYEDMLRQLSTLGFWFKEDLVSGSVISQSIILGQNCTDERCIMPEIINGRTTGNYKRGTAAAADPQASWGTDWRENVNYTGDKPYAQESEKTEFPAYVISVPAFGKTYVFDYTDIAVLGERLKNFGQTEYDPKVFYNQNPIECIGFIKVFPFSNFQMRACLDGPVASRTSSIFIGLWDSEVPAIYTQIKSTDMSDPIWEGEDTIRPKWGDFRDYEPYSKYSLYLPFCGTIEIPATIILNNKITVKYSLDVLSGQVTAYVLINDILYCTASGNCALEVPIDGYRIADYKSDMLNLETSKIIAKTNFGNDIAMSLRGSGNALMTEGINRKHIANPLVTTGGFNTSLGSAVQAFSSTMQNLATYKKYSQLVDYTAPAPAFISPGSGLGAWCNPLNVQVIIQEPKMLQFNEEIYAKTTGYACCIYGKLNSQQEEGKDNFVQVNDIILDDIPLTETEKTNLLSLLQSGVII